MIMLIIGLAAGLLSSRTALATRAYTATATRLTFLPRP